MKLLKPKATDVFSISAAADWPSIEFETDSTGEHTWAWTVAWGAFKKTGSVKTTGNKWNAGPVISGYGGTLTVVVTIAKPTTPPPRTTAAVATTAMVAVKVTGTNPATTAVDAYLATKPDSTGFEKIIAQEARYKHFNTKNEPIKSFDNGYGMCQLTTPTPTFEQVWNWKLNVDGGLKLFAQKRASAISYLSQSSRTYTTEQLTYETVCRWNGGSYHVWDTTALKWKRPSHILCDSKTGNIGWDMTDANNKDKTEADLRKRDSAEFSKPPGSGAKWKYSGVCYADHVLG